MPRFLPSTCLLCGAAFRSRRNLATYCCNAHRQAAYRLGAFTPNECPVNTRRNKNQSTARQIAGRNARKKATAARNAAPRRHPNKPPRPPRKRLPATRRNAKRTPNKTRRPKPAAKPK